MRGKLITFEGIDCAGKTTQIRLLANYLDSKGIPYIVTHQPYDPKVRELILSKRAETDLAPIAELMLYMADRAQHCQDIILPALKQGKIVICDRFVDSSVAYQGYGRGLDIDTIMKLNATAIQGVDIDLTYFLDVSVDMSFTRRRAKSDRIESMPKAFFESVRQGFVDLSNKHGRFARIDADASVEQVNRDIIKTFEVRLPDCFRHELTDERLVVAV
jgi:dTMP kinase